MKHRFLLYSIVVMFGISLAISKRSTAPQDKFKYKGEYDAELNRIYSVLLGKSDDEYGNTGLLELVRYQSTSEVLESVGYVINDINGDAIPELLIGYVPNGSIENTSPNALFSVYTLINGKPKLLLEGWSRNTLVILNDGRIFTSGSVSAASHIYAVYSISKETALLNCDAYYFTDTWDINSPHYYYNTVGKYDKNISEELNLDTSEFIKKIKPLYENAIQIELLPFSYFS